MLLHVANVGGAKVIVVAILRLCAAPKDWREDAITSLGVARVRGADVVVVADLVPVVASGVCRIARVNSAFVPIVAIAISMAAARDVLMDTFAVFRVARVVSAEVMVITVPWGACTLLRRWVAILHCAEVAIVRALWREDAFTGYFVAGVYSAAQAIVAYLRAVKAIVDT